MPTPLIAKIDRLATPVGEPPAHFFDVVAGLPGLEAAHFLSSSDEQQRVGIWVWRGREGMQEGHAALAKAMGHLGPPPMIEERVLDVVSAAGAAEAVEGTTAVIVHLGPFRSAEHRQANLANVDRAETAIRGIAGFRSSLIVADPAGRDILGLHFWDTAPQPETVRDAIAAQPLPPGVDGSLLGDPSYVEHFTVVRSVRPAVTA